jgi:4-hydroxybenzoate polyprenyltransferase
MVGGEWMTVIKRERFFQYVALMRLNKPIGIGLLLWPTLWALWFAERGHPHGKMLFIFIAGVVLMRSAGCVINDIVDRHVDGWVWRTKQRPLPSGHVQPVEAFILFVVLSGCAFMLVLFCNALTIGLAVIGMGVTVIYPFLKRLTHLPQIGIGVAFMWGVPMAFAAVTGTVSGSAWFLFFTGLIWVVIYDTMYAMADREDDLKVGIKSTAILLGQQDRFIIGSMQILFLIMLYWVGTLFQLTPLYQVCLVPVMGLCLYQQWLIKDRDPQRCLRAFFNNHWVGCAVFLGIVAGIGS